MQQYQEAKKLIVEAARQLTHKGYLSATGGNLSIRIPGHNALAITPSNYDYLKMVPDDICILDLLLKPLDGKRKPSVESGLHAAIYRVRPDVNAVIHTHQVYPSTLAIINKPIPALYDEQARFLGRYVSIIPYAPSGTGVLMKKVEKKVRDYNNAYLMANHGALLLGTDLERAIHNVDVLEKCALSYLLAFCTGLKACKIPLIVREVAFAKLRKDQKKVERALKTGGINPS
jgi:L-ribulose-5-phosphate 4-epimerase